MRLVLQWMLAGCLMGWCVICWSFDPMAPPAYKQGSMGVTLSKKAQTRSTKKSSGFVLRQLVISPLGKSAVINGYVVNEGSFVNHALVQSIDANSVTLLVKGKVKQLTLEESIPRIRH